MAPADDVPDTAVRKPPKPPRLLAPAAGVPPVSVSVDEIAAAAATLAAGTGPFAVDAERASGFRYSTAPT